MRTLIQLFVLSLIPTAASAAEPLALDAPAPEIDLSEAMSEYNQTTTEVELTVDGPPTGFGLGVVVGEPTGLTFALRPDEYNALQMHASWSVIADRARVSVDYLRSVAIARGSGWSAPFYVGLGGIVGVQGDSGPFDNDANLALGARVPIGFAVHPSDVPIEPFLEVAPGVLVLPATTPIFEGSLGVRYYF